MYSDKNKAPAGGEKTVPRLIRVSMRKWSGGDGLQKSTAILGTASRLFALGSQFIVILILARLMTKDAFGDFMIAFATYRVFSTGIGNGLAAVLLYHLSRATESGPQLEVQLHRTALLVSGVIAMVLCGSFWLGSETIAQAFAKPALATWMQVMLPFLFFSIMGMVTSGSYEGRSRVSTSIFLTEVAPNGIRLVLLAALPLGGFRDVWVAHAMALSVGIPWLISVRHLWQSDVRGIKGFTAWDYGYAGKLMLYNFAALQVQGVDMIVAGWLFPSEAVADYAVASRIASLFPFFLQLRIRMFGPVAGRLLAANDKAGLQREAMVAKEFSLALVAMTIALLLLASPIFMQMFWSSDTLAVLLVLSAFAPTYRTLFAIGDRTLQLAGHANWNLGIMMSALAIVVGFPTLTGELIGIASLPIAMMASGFILNPVIAYAVRRTTGVLLLRRSDVMVVAAIIAAVTVPLAFTHGTTTLLLSGGLFMLLGSVVLIKTHPQFRKKCQ